MDGLTCACAKPALIGQELFFSCFGSGWSCLGIDGQSVRYRRIILATWATGYLILLLVQVAISSSVSTRTLAFVGLAGPLLLAGLTYILASALGRNRQAFALGAWLVIVAASCAWLAPATILATCALAGGGAFLLMAVIETWAPRTCPLTPTLTPSSMRPRGCVSW